MRSTPPPPPRRTPPRPDSGFSMVVVMLVSVIVLGSITGTTAYLAMRSNTAVKSESGAFSALLAAESGLQALKGRTGIDGLDYGGALTTAGLNTWFVNEGLSSTALPNGATAAVSVVSVTASGLATVKSVGREQSGDITKTLFQDFRYRKDPNAPGVTASGAMTSYAPVYINGQPSINGQDANATGIFKDPVPSRRITTKAAVTLATLPWSNTFTLPLNDPAYAIETQRVPSGAFIEIGGRIFKVESKTDTHVTLRPLDTTNRIPAAAATVNIPNNAEIGVVPNGILQSKSYTGVNPFVLKVSRPMDFVVGDTINVDYLRTTGSGTATGRILSVNESTSELSISFSTTGCATCSTPASDAYFPEGKPAVRIIVGISSGSTISGASGSTTTIPNDSRVPNPYSTSGNQLFQSIFNQSYESFLEAYPPKTMTSLNNLSGINVINGGRWNGNNGICGSGVLVVIGDFSANSSPQCKGQPFRGLIYVTGNTTMMGNLGVTGAFVTQGTITNGYTNIGGSGNTDRLSYDQFAVYEAGMLMSRASFLPQDGTWRQQ